MRVESRIERPFVITPEGVTITTHDGITVRISGTSPVFDSMLAEMFRTAMKEVKRIRADRGTK